MTILAIVIILIILNMPAMLALLIIPDLCQLLIEIGEKPAAKRLKEELHLGLNHVKPMLDL